MGVESRDPLGAELEGPVKVKHEEGVMGLFLRRCCLGGVFKSVHDSLNLLVSGLVSGAAEIDV